LSTLRAGFLQCASQLAQLIFEKVDEEAIDEGADALVMKFLKERLPTTPAPVKRPTALSAAAARDAASPDEVDSRAGILEHSAVRLVNPLNLRLTLQAMTNDGEAVEGGVAVVTCSAKNSMRFLQRAPETVQFPARYAPAVEALIAAHPSPIVVGDLPVLVDEQGNLMPASQVDLQCPVVEDSDSEQEEEVVATLAEILDALEAIGAIEVVA
jgi:hypothetical protein